MIAALAALRRTQASGWLDPRGLALVQHLLARCSSSAGPEPVQQHPWSEAASGAPGCSGATAPAWPRLLPLGARCFASDRGLTRQRPGQQQRGGRPGGGAQQQPGGGSGSSGGRAPPKKLRARRNEEIRASEVRAILPDGGNQVKPARNRPAAWRWGVVLAIGGSQVLPLAQALALARSMGLDLVEVPGTRNPLVAKIVDYEAQAAAQRKADEEAARQQRLREKLATPKEIQFTARIGDHDLEIKLRKVNEFLEDGLKVHLVVKHRRNEGTDASSSALDYILERLRSERPGLEVGKTTMGGRSTDVTVSWPPGRDAASKAA